MKIQITKIILGIALLTGSAHNAISQFNVATNSYDPMVVHSNAITENTAMKKSGITCNPNTFFSVNNNGEVVEYTLSGGVITASTPVVNGCGTGLAVCDNLNGGAYSPTFYSNTSLDEIIYFDGASWVVAGTYSTIFNPGGNNTDLYFTGLLPGSYFAKTIEVYNGTSLNTIYANNNRMVLGDLNVDEFGYVWFLSTADTISFIADSITVLSNTGQTIAQYSINLNCYNYYGGMILNDILYVGLGSNNPVYPSTLIPITFLGGFASIGTPVDMSSTSNLYDLASCNHGNPGGFVGLSSLDKTPAISIMPNPATDMISIQGLSNLSNTDQMEILSAYGELVMSLDTKASEISIASLPAGVYFLRVSQVNESYVLRFVKQ